MTPTPSHRRLTPRRAVLPLVLIVAGLFGAGVAYRAIDPSDSPCGDELPVAERPGILGQREYRCPDGRTVTQ